MIPCSECGAWFFTIQGRREHTKLCIGHNPDPDKIAGPEFFTGLELRE